MPSILRKPFKRMMRDEAVVGGDKYIDLGDIEFDEIADDDTINVKVAEIFRYEDLAELAEHVYKGNILLLDFTSISNDQLALKRVISELKSVVRDTNGDVAGVGKNMMIVTPTGIKVDRKKIRGPY
jgi:SepF-like predicted cell division protein (DUF552 family)